MSSTPPDQPADLPVAQCRFKIQHEDWDSPEFMVEFHWWRSDPLAVWMHILADGEPWWVVPRELLSDGLTSLTPVGQGDIQIWRPNRGRLYMSLTGQRHRFDPDINIVLWTSDVPQIGRLLDSSWLAIPHQTEIDLEAPEFDAKLADWLAG